MSFKNGQINNKKGLGWKAICLSDSYRMLDIVYAVHNGSPKIKGSYQATPKVGHFVFKVVWKFNKTGVLEEKYQVFVVATSKKKELKLTQIPIMEAGQFWKVAEATNPWMKDWLQPTTERGVFLPPEAGPVLSEVRKHNQWLRFLNKYGSLDTYVDYHAIDNGPRFCIELSSSKGLQYEAKELDFDPDKAYASSCDDPNDITGQHKHTMFFLSDGRGNLFDPRHEELNVVGLRKWRSHRYIVKLVIGAYFCVRDGFPRTHGVTIDVYRTSNSSIVIR